jgi:hypothetical protein
MGMRTLTAAVMLAATYSGAVAQDQPITSPQDAQCRDEARDKVFAAPNPKGLTPFALGAEIYHACMRRLGAEGREAPRE